MALVIFESAGGEGRTAGGSIRNRCCRRMLPRSIPSRINLSVDASISTPAEEKFCRFGKRKVPFCRHLYHMASPSASQYTTLIRSALLFRKTNNEPERGSR